MSGQHGEDMGWCVDIAVALRLRDTRKCLGFTVAQRARLYRDRVGGKVLRLGRA